METDLCRPRFIRDLFLNFNFCLEIFLEGYRYLRLNRSWSEKLSSPNLQIGCQE